MKITGNYMRKINIVTGRWDHVYTKYELRIKSESYLKEENMLNSYISKLALVKIKIIK